MRKIAGLLGAASLALVLLQAPAQAGGDITNFKVRNCTQERIFVCSFDKTDSLMKVPYKARGIQPGDKKEFGCASIGRCKVIIGVSKKTSAKTLSSGMEIALSATSASGAAVAATGAGLFYTVGAGAMSTATAAPIIVVGTASTAAFVALAAGGAVASIEIADGWSDGEVCNQVKKAARKANLKPKHFMQNNRNYKVIEQYALDKDGNAYVNADGTAVFAYATKKGKSACPTPLATQLVPN